jgi:hypothetical protein
MSIAQDLAASPDPVVAYKARTRLLGESPAAALRERVRASKMARQLLGRRRRDGTIGLNPYRKWQGAHWTLYSLAEISYPPGDTSLRPLLDQAYAWLLSPEHLQPPRTVVLPGQEDRPRRCASQEGNAIWYTMELGLDDPRIETLVDRLVAWQWPDGGWNCDRAPGARTSSIIETLVPLRALARFGRDTGHRGALAAAGRAAEFLLQRRLLFRLRDGRLIRPAWEGDITKIHYPVRFYDVLFALNVMAEIGRIGDVRCADALDLLASKRLPGGGFPLETKTCRTSSVVVTRGSDADWGPAGKSAMNPLVTIEALSALRARP